MVTSDVDKDDFKSSSSVHGDSTYNVEVPGTADAFTHTPPNYEASGKLEEAKETRMSIGDNNKKGDGLEVHRSVGLVVFRLQVQYRLEQEPMDDTQPSLPVSNHANQIEEKRKSIDADNKEESGPDEPSRKQKSVSLSRFFDNGTEILI